MNWRDNLRRAADIVEARGLRQGGVVGDDGSVCAGGAIAEAITGDPMSASYWDYDSHNGVGSLERSAVLRHVGLLHTGGPATVMAMCTWNNARGRTAAEVAEVFRRASEVERG